MSNRYVSSSSARALQRGAALAAVALALAACSSSPGTASNPATSPAASASGHGVTYRGTIYVSSQVNNSPKSWHITRSFVDRVASMRDCATAAKNGVAPGLFQVPSPKAPSPQDVIQVQGFHGPGTYPPNVMQRDKSDFILMPGKLGTRRYEITTSTRGGKSGKEVLFLNKDGSGQLVYSQAHLDGRAAGPAVAGLISWSCKS